MLAIKESVHSNLQLVQMPFELFPLSVPLNPNIHTCTHHWVIQATQSNWLFLTVGGILCHHGTLKYLTRKKDNRKHQKLNLLPFPALLCSLFTTPYIAACFWSPHHPPFFCCHFYLHIYFALGLVCPFRCLWDVIRISVFPPLSLRWLKQPVCFKSLENYTASM